jgi:hypothetical protein
MKFRTSLILFLTLAFSGAVLGQSSHVNQRKSGYLLLVKRDSIMTVTLKSKDAPLAEIVKELAQKIRIPITLSEKLKNERISLNFSNISWQEALRELAPQGYADFVIRGGEAREPKCLGIFLLEHAEKSPSENINIKLRSEAFLLEGDTETTEKPNEESSLQVNVQRGLITVRAHQQPLSVVLYKVADAFGVPFELRNEIPELLNVNMTAATPLQLLQRLPAVTQLYYRRNLQTTLDKPLRLLLEKPAPEKTDRDQKSEPNRN